MQISPPLTRSPSIRGLTERAAQVLGARNSLYPIPAREIELSRVGTEERLVQNPGW